MLFALDELRCMEEERSGASARAAREQAKRDRDREAEARRRQQQSEQQSAELVALRERAQVEETQRAELAARLVEEGARRRALEWQLQRLSMQHPSSSDDAPSAPSRSHPALWSIALLGLGAILFWLIPRQAAPVPPSPVVAESAPVAFEAVAADCPEPAPVEALPPPRPSLAEQVPVARPSVPRTIREKRPPRPVQPASTLPVDCTDKGPLCGLPED